MKCHEYMKIPFIKFLKDIIERYNLHDKFHKDYYVSIKIKNGMYELK